MALKTDVSGVADALEDLASRAGSIIQEQGCDELISEIRVQIVALNELADLIPTPDEARTTEAKTHSDLVAALQRIADYDEDFSPADDNMRAIARLTLQRHHALNTLTEQDGYPPWHAANNWSLPIGTPLDLGDRLGDRLRVGDRVQVSGSDRYGNPTGTVRGPGPDRGDGKERVHVELDGGIDSEYTPSTGRVELIPARAPHDRNGGPLAVLIEVLPSGLKITQIPA